jgi:hypothetical protein
MDIKEIVWEDVEFINLFWDREKWWGVINIEMKISVP